MGNKPVLRSKRFNVKPDSDVRLVIETCTGQRYVLAVQNLSTSGIGARFTTEVEDELAFAPDTILPCAKLLWNDDKMECVLGRLNVRRFMTNEESGMQTVAMATIDTNIPIDGPISFQLADLIVTHDMADIAEINPEKFSLADLAQCDGESIDLLARYHSASVFRREWRKKPQYMYETTRRPSLGTRVNLVTSRKNQRNSFIVMGSNDYLGLAAHPEVIAAAKKALDEYGFGSTGSPVTTGRAAIHEELCETVAHMFRKDAAILFNSGYTANVGAISALVNSGDFVVADMLSHASIHDGLQMCKGVVRYFRHNDPKHLERLLAEHRQEYKGCMVITEGVFSMDGDIAKISDVVNVARQWNARTYVDEAHSFGVVGDNGLGIWEKLDAGESVDMFMGTFSKIAGGIGGFVTGDQEVIDWLHFFARSQMFSVSIPPSTAAGVLKALQIFQSDKSLLQNLRSNIRYFVNGMRSLGAPVNPNHESAVIPIVIGDEKKLGMMNEVLLGSGIYVVPIVYPAVSRNSSRFRFTVMATHTQSDLDLVLFQFEKAMKEADFKFGECRAAEGQESSEAKRNNLRLAS